MNKKTDVISRARQILKSLEITTPYEFLRARKRAEVMTVIKERLPATEAQLIARLRLILGFAPYIAKYEIDALKVEQLIKHKNRIYYATELFETYLAESWKKIQNYRTEHPEEIFL